MIRPLIDAKTRDAKTWDAKTWDARTWDARTWLLVAALGALAVLAGAHAFETFGRYEPCELCYLQRDVHWAAFWVAGVGYGVSRFRPGFERLLCGVVAVIFLASTAVAAYHAGVEWKWWPGPTSCTGSHFKAVSAADMASLLNGTANHVVACDAAAWRLFGISMAGYNAVISAALAGISALAAWRGGLGIGVAPRPSPAAKAAPAR